MDAEREIRQEIVKAAEAMDVPAEAVKALSLATAAKFYRALELLNASPYLLAIVGSWRDTMTDAETLQALKAWNKRGGWNWDARICSTGEMDG